MLWVVTPNDVYKLYPRSRIILFVLITVLSIYGRVKILSGIISENKEAQTIYSATKLEPVDSYNRDRLAQIHCDDIPTEFSPPVNEIISMAEYDINYGGKALCLAIKYNNKYVGVISIGESLRRHEVPYKLAGEKHYILHGLLIDSRYHRIGIGSAALAKATDILFDRYGDRPILAQCAKGNEKALMFFKKNNFVDSGELNRAGTDCFLIF